MLKKNVPLTIAGFDPCSGAGLTRDLLVFKDFGFEGISVCTAITYQNNYQFEKVEWLTVQQILSQLTILEKEYLFSYVKIGLVENEETLEEVVRYIHDINNEVKIIWDPILSASAGFDFHKNNVFEQMKILDLLYLVTPNKSEAEKMNLIADLPNLKTFLSNFLIKSFRNNENTIDDLLIVESQEVMLSVNKIPQASIHGSGCRLSSAILANLILLKPLEEAVIIAQSYLSKLFIEKNAEK